MMRVEPLAFTVRERSSQQSRLSRVSASLRRAAGRKVVHARCPILHTKCAGALAREEAFFSLLGNQPLRSRQALLMRISPVCARARRKSRWTILRQGARV